MLRRRREPSQGFDSSRPRLVVRLQQPASPSAVPVKAPRPPHLELRLHLRRSSRLPQILLPLRRLLQIDDPNPSPRIDLVRRIQSPRYCEQERKKRRRIVRVKG